MDELKKISLIKEIPQDVIAVFFPSLVHIYSVLPVRFITGKEDGKSKYVPPAVEVAFGEEALKGNLESTIEDLKFMIRREIIPVYAQQKEIDLAIERYYGKRDENVSCILEGFELR